MFKPQCKNLYTYIPRDTIHASVNTRDDYKTELQDAQIHVMPVTISGICTAAHLIAHSKPPSENNGKFYCESNRQLT